MAAGLPLKGPFTERPWLLRPKRGSTVPTAPAAPATPNTPSPSDGGTADYTLLSWVSARATKYDIYFGTSASPSLLIPKYVGTSWVPTVTPSTTFYWKITAFNDGGSATGPVWSFTTRAAGAVVFSLAGTTPEVRFPDLTINDVLNDAPNTASMTIDTTAPTAGEAIRIGLGSLDDDALLFAGEILTIAPSYEGRPGNRVWPVTLIDHTFRINRRRPFGVWVDESATTVAQALVSTYASGFTAANVAPDLPTVSIVFDGSEGFMTAMSRLATAIGGYCYVDYAKDVHLFLEETADAPDPIDASHSTQLNPPVSFSTDLSQVRTRIYGKGAREQVPCDVAAGETILPIDSAVIFNQSGGQAIAATTSDGAQSEILTYAGVQLGGGGSLVGPGAAPSTAPTVVAVAGVGLGSGVFQYAYTDTTAAGESIPSPRGTVTTFAIVAPSVAPNIANVFDGTNLTTSYAIGDSVEMWITYSAAVLSTDFTMNTGAGPISTFTAISDGLGDFNPVAPTVQVTHSLDAHVKWVHVWRRVNAGSFVVERSIANVPGGLSTFLGGASGSLRSTTANTTFQQVAISAVALGPATTTSRKIYRTAAGSSQLKLQQTIANNTATTGVQDTTPDGSLGANAPTGDTSGLTQPSGQVNAGSTSIPTASAGPFNENGGWVTLGGGQTVRYTSISGNTLTGVPASGEGAIATTVVYGSQALPAPALTGINALNGLTRALARGSSVNIWVQRDDLAEQAALGALELDDDGHPSDGIREFLITDERRGEASLTALVDANLALYKSPIITVKYSTRDPKTRSGKTVAIDLPQIGLTGAFVIQDVTIRFVGTPNEIPVYAVTASTVRFSLEALLRLALPP